MLATCSPPPLGAQSRRDRSHRDLGRGQHVRRCFARLSGSWRARGSEARLAGFLVVWGFALGSGDWSNLTPFWSQRPGSEPLLPALAGGLILAFFSFGGWWDVSKLAGEVRDPERTLPRSSGPGRRDRHGRLPRHQHGVSLPGACQPGSPRTRHSRRWRAKLSSAELARSFSRPWLSSPSLEASPPFSWRSPAFTTPWHGTACFPSVRGCRSQPRAPRAAIALQAGSPPCSSLTGTFDQILTYFMVPTMAFLGTDRDCGLRACVGDSPPLSPLRTPGLSRVTPLVHRSDTRGDRLADPAESSRPAKL